MHRNSSNSNYPLPVPAVRVLRVAQVDAARLDGELAQDAVARGKAALAPLGALRQAIRNSQQHQQQWRRRKRRRQQQQLLEERGGGGGGGSGTAAAGRSDDEDDDDRRRGRVLYAGTDEATTGAAAGENNNNNSGEWWAARWQPELLLLVELSAFALSMGSPLGAGNAAGPSPQQPHPACASHGAALQNLRLADGRSHRDSEGGLLQRLLPFLPSASSAAASTAQRVGAGQPSTRIRDLPPPSVAQRAALGLLSVVLKWAWMRLAMVVQSRHASTLRGRDPASAARPAGGPEDVATRLRRLREEANRRAAAAAGSQNDGDGDGVGGAGTGDSSWWRRAANSPHLWPTMQRTEAVLKLLGVVNFVAFLLNGRYPTLVHRILGLRYVWAGPAVKRVVSFEYMNRQLVWQGFTEFLLFAVPLLNSSGARRWASRLAHHTSSLRFPSLGSSEGPSSASDPASNSRTSRAKQALNCQVCSTTPPTNPHVGECGHIFCYWCVANELLDDPGFMCPSCRVAVGAKPRRAEYTDMIARVSLPS